MYEMIEYNGKEYPAIEVSLDEEWGGLVSTESLEKALMPNDKYADDLARQIDEGIFYFVPDEKIYSDDLAEYVKENVL